MKDVKAMTFCSLFSVLIAVGAFIKIPISIVPITLQTLFVAMAGLLLGKKRAFLSVFIYIVIGLIGLPIFANGGGITYILQPTFGYLIGFLVVSYFIGLFTKPTSSIRKMMFVSIIGMFIIYLIGMIYFNFIQGAYYGLHYEWSWIVYYLFLVYLPGDIISCVIAVFVSRRLLKIDIFKQIREDKNLS